MKIVDAHVLISKGGVEASAEWIQARQDVEAAIKAVDWPVGSGSFTINPMKHGNGVKPIKLMACATLLAKGWELEHAWPIKSVSRPGKMDAALIKNGKIIAFEWETGNISSSHRSINKLFVGVRGSYTVGGIIVVPSNKLSPYLTDRVGNIGELKSYLDFWKDVQCNVGVVEIIVIEHDATNSEVPLIAKGTDGRAKV